MATIGKGNRRTIYYTCSTGKIGDSKAPAQEFRVPSPWKPGRSKNKSFK